METSTPSTDASSEEAPCHRETDLLVVDHLHVTYGKTVAVKDLSFSVPRGEIFGFIGPNGAGKTSTFKVIATLLKPARGNVFVNGINVVKEPEMIRRIIGYAPDFFGVYEDLTVREYLHFFAAAYRLETKKRKAVVDDVLALTDLSGKVDAPVDGLSRGMKQRLSIARVLLHDPQLLILDEPASGLDPRARIEMRELLKELKDMGKTILVSSHILHELSQFCTRIGILEAGDFVAMGSLDDIYKALQLQRVVHVQLVGARPDQIEGIRRIPAVRQVDEGADRIGIHWREDEMAVEDLHEAICQLGLRLRMFQPEAMDMETAFMKLTEGKTA
ncbi:MAG: ABC transporter ATP-binding protein [Verrucomicrobiota bacterium]